MKIKYQAFDKVTKKMCTLREFDPVIIQQEGKFEIYQGDDCDYLYLQYTGKDDSGGNEIYDGDILLGYIDKNSRPFLLFVCWEDYSWCLKLYTTDERFDSFNDWFSEMPYEYIIKIGNIHIDLERKLVIDHYKDHKPE